MNPLLPLEGLLRPWQQVAAKADDFYQEVLTRHGASMQCARGCCDCCRQDLSVLLAESLAILSGLSRLSADHRRRLRLARPKHGEKVCALLVDDHCAVYDMRPMICRTHGLPIRHDTQGVLWCERNFSEGPPPKEAILNASLLTAGLVVADAMIRKRLEVDKPVRIPIRRLVAQGWEALPGQLVAAIQNQIKFYT